MRVMQFDNKWLSWGARYRALLLTLTALIFGAIYGFGLVYATPPWALLAAPLVLVAVAVILHTPELGVVLFIGLVWGYISEIALKYYGVPSINKPLAALLVTIIVLRRFSGQRTPLVKDSTSWWMLVYWVIIAAGLWYAGDTNATMARVVDFTKDLTLYFVIINLLASVTSFERVMWLLLSIGALLGTLTLYQELTQSYGNIFGGLARVKMAFITDEFGNRPRAAGTTGEPLVYGQQLLVLVPIGLWGAFYGRTLFSRIFATYATIACISGVVLSFSRSSYIALILVFALFVLHVHLNPRYIILVALLVAGLWRVAPPEFTARLNTLEHFIPSSTSQGVDSEGSFRSRSSEASMAISMFLDHPIVGVGADNYRDLYPIYIRENGSPVADEERNAHSFYLEVAAEHGIIGFFVWSAILMSAWWRYSQAQRYFAQANNNRMAELAVALRIGFTGYLVSAIFYHGGYPSYLWLQIGLAVALATIAKAYLAQHSLIPAQASRSTHASPA